MVASVGAALLMLVRWARPWLGTAAAWVIGLPFLVLGVYLVLLGPAWAAIKITEKALSTHVRIDEIAAVFLFMAVTFTGLRWALAHRRLTASRRVEAILRIALVVPFAVASFSSLTAVLYQRGALTVAGERLPQEHVFDKTAEFYVWHLTNSVPVLNIPENLEWKEPFQVDRLGGLLLVVFTAVVILPLIPAVRLAVASRADAHEEAVFKALRKSGRNWKVRSHPVPTIRHSAIVEELGVAIVVDAIRDVTTEELALRRLKTAGVVLAGTGVDRGGYVFVGDHFGDRARERIEAAFAAREDEIRAGLAREDVIRARLVAWRGGEQPAPLVSVVDGLFGELVAFEDAVVAALEGVAKCRVHRRSAGAFLERDGVRVRVDVARDLGAPSDALGWLKSASSSVEGDEPNSGYLLVAGLAGVRTRRPIERAFGQSELPAKLIVWPKDGPERLVDLADGFLHDVTPKRSETPEQAPAAAS
jgi:hypothetical protein